MSKTVASNWDWVLSFMSECEPDVSICLDTEGGNGNYTVVLGLGLAVRDVARTLQQHEDLSLSHQESGADVPYDVPYSSSGVRGLSGMVPPVWQAGRAGEDDHPKSQPPRTTFRLV